MTNYKRNKFYYLLTICASITWIIVQNISMTVSQLQTLTLPPASGSNAVSYDLDINTETTTPIILWWAPIMGMLDQTVHCDSHTCLVSTDKQHKYNPDTHVYAFYGSDFMLNELPLPRRGKDLWALLHEESPKNNAFLFAFEDIMTLFNYTGTFKRQSHYPLPTQYLPSLEWLQSKEFLVPVHEKNRLKREEGLAPVLFIHSDCGAPSDRDTYMELLQQYVPVDSYGTCKNNKELPEELKFNSNRGMMSLTSKEFFRFVSKYKFALAMENAVCDDYMTEKLWRPMHVGSIPVVFGSAKVHDYLPTSKSALVINDFPNVEELAKKIQEIDADDDLYNEYLSYKETDGIDNKFLINTMKEREWSRIDTPGFHRATTKFQSYFDGFQCFLCSKIHDNIARAKNKQGVPISIATKDHYGCPPPKQFDVNGLYTLESNQVEYFNYTKNRVKAFRYFYDKNMTFSTAELMSKTLEITHKGS